MANVENIDRLLKAERPEIREEITREGIVERLCADAALYFQVNAALILCAPDPIRMLEILRPRITKPDIDGGRFPQMYLKIVRLALANIEGAATEPAGPRPH